jgi:hypothetical protein
MRNLKLFEEFGHSKMELQSLLSKDLTKDYVKFVDDWFTKNPNNGNCPNFPEWVKEYNSDITAPEIKI